MTTLDNYFDLPLDESILWSLLQINFGKTLSNLETISSIIKKHNIQSIYDFQELNNNSSFTTKELSIINQIKLILNNPSKLYINQIKSLIEEKRNIKIVHYNSVLYPSNLKKIKNPPLAFILKGKLPNFSKAIAIVGRRQASSHALDIAFQLGQFFARKNFVVISGMAHGVDSFAHVGTLSKDGITIAILGTPINKIYPASNKGIYDDIVKTGAIISDTIFDNRLVRKNLYERNRIISGLSKIVIVVESDEKGGTIRQIEYALNQKKPVFMYIPPKTHIHYNKAKKISKTYDLREFYNLEDLYEKMLAYL